MRYVCQICGFVSPRWFGKCPNCGSWNTFVEEIEERRTTKKQKSSKSSTTQENKIIPADKVTLLPEEFRLKSGISEFDRVLGGGIVQSSVILISGEPGVGKSTLLLQVASKISDKGKVIYASSEESPVQIVSRLRRLKEKLNSNLYVCFENNAERAFDQVSSLGDVSFVILDSIQSFYSDELESAPGTVSQVRHIAIMCQEFARSKKIPIVIVGHVTKEGVVAGPKTLEHIVDVVLYIEPEGMWRVLRATKNRFGSTGEIGFFVMSESGLQEVQNPNLFDLDILSIPGASLSCVMEGSRLYVVEVQALVSKTHFPVPRRSAQGYDILRLNNIITVLEKFVGLTLYDKDVLVNIAGGIRVSDVSVDLAVVSSIVSSYYGIPLGRRVFFGEVGLLGEIRSSEFADQKVSEVAKLKPTEIITGKTNSKLVKVFYNLKDFCAYISKLPKIS
ncbi:MAG: DNA repair protein RadA [Candidatus Calescibacterium sp.]|nr:DNA repair protein RadA [Candidatus Calescibacterium sp.]MCX7733991.1 DNA repair protein RadA [bacterium]MDW8086410.1 DNA repair protein RadA [Candidatus Calescibacterium sp.]